MTIVGSVFVLVLIFLPNVKAYTAPGVAEEQKDVGI